MDSNETEKIDLEELISSFKVQDKNIFKRNMGRFISKK